MERYQLFVQDATGGIYVGPAGNKTPLQPGQRVELEGVSSPGGYKPCVSLTRLTPLGTATMPEPQSHPIQHLLTGEEDCNWGEVEGIVRSVGDDGGHLMLRLAKDGMFFTAVVLVFPQTDMAGLVNTRVLLRGV